jgi:hypothetical protein
MPLTGLKVPNSEDAYAHLGVKFGGMSLDGEGSGGVMVANPRRPWEETSLTLDAFGYHGLNVLDSGTGIMAMPAEQRSRINAVGGTARLILGSFMLNAGLQFESHQHPYPGTPGTDTKAGKPDLTSGKGYTQFAEADYIVWPWFVPGVRTELTHVKMEGGDSANLLRIMPGIAMLARANIKIVVTGELEFADNLPPAGGWDPAGGFIVPKPGKSKFAAEQINAVFAWAF